MYKFIALLMFVTVNSHADMTLRPTIPGIPGAVDYSKPALVIKSIGESYYTVPGIDVRDYTRPGFVIDGKRMQPTLPGGNGPDYTKPGMDIE